MINMRTENPITAGENQSEWVDSTIKSETCRRSGRWRSIKEFSIGAGGLLAGSFGGAVLGMEIGVVLSGETVDSLFNGSIPSGGFIDFGSKTGGLVGAYVGIKLPSIIMTEKWHCLTNYLRWTSI